MTRVGSQRHKKKELKKMCKEVTVASFKVAYSQGTLLEWVRGKTKTLR
jgi:hypothetical protein